MFQFAKHYGVMWIVFVILVSIGAFGLEIMEGEKIKTTEYYGLQNLGSMYLAVILLFISLPASVLYFVALLPLSVLFQKVNSTAFLVRTVIFSVLGAVGGKWLFHKQFSDYFVKGYELKELTAVIIFGICGLVYSLIDGFLAKKVTWVKRESH
ncbi:hypothetical protein [Paenibacillus prosopidis]|uniref:Uncharacterized protein n=1 Tax=Paenibacillus prosopidis TaxID=630520 RepID=A0A368W5E2_9BACL|nr:hypothetical protein [Paenibacillus prosopidis]RCW49484.1 hypothetical protein DFP97_104142 [Paenibacillus prosopidis]